MSITGKGNATIYAPTESGKPSYKDPLPSHVDIIYSGTNGLS